MNADIKKICMLLAAAGFNRQRVSDVIYALKDAGERKTLSEFDKCYKFLQGNYEKDGGIGNKKVHGDRNLDNDLAERIQELLIEETKIPTGRIFLMLEAILMELYPNRWVAKPNPKSGFLSWIRQLNKEFTDSELLHVANRLRNKIIHEFEDNNDWTLKE